MSLEKKSIEELLDLEEELKAEMDLKENVSYAKLIRLYETLYRKIRREPNNEYKASLEKIRQHLIFHLVQYGTYMKTVYRQDDKAAENSLGKALRYEKNLPIVHYRLGFLHYKQRSYTSALLHFDSALRFQMSHGFDKYRLNDQQLHNCHLYLSNCGLFIAKNTQEDLDNLNLNVDMKNVLHYEISPLYRLISENEQYLARHEYCKISLGSNEYCTKQDCEPAREEQETIILDFTEREISVIYNGIMNVLSRNRGEIFRYFLLKSNEAAPLTRHDFYDIFSVSGENGEVPKNTYTQNIRRLRAIFKEIGIKDDIVINKPGSSETAYYYNQKYPFIILHRSDDTFLLNG
ncbi:tetratricopeptide repeat protein [Rossellomorea vietnamensis]|uniref:tetratricopeptide repeat protein n=1 Tax=Rossellomorea vietnamensis TaxID=218284 RepID=UPI003CEFD59B